MHTLRRTFMALVGSTLASTACAFGQDVIPGVPSTPDPKPTPDVPQAGISRAYDRCVDERTVVRIMVRELRASRDNLDVAVATLMKDRDAALANVTRLMKELLAARPVLDATTPKTTPDALVVP